jgi:hypothetical protein
LKLRAQLSGLTWQLLPWPRIGYWCSSWYRSKAANSESECNERNLYYLLFHKMNATNNEGSCPSTWFASCFTCQTTAFILIKFDVGSVHNDLAIEQFNTHVAFGGLVVSVLATGPKVRGFKPGRVRWIFKGDKIRGTTSFGGEVKSSVPCRRFTACKRTLRAWKRCFVSKIKRSCFSPMSLLLRY